MGLALPVAVHNNTPIIHNEKFVHGTGVYTTCDRIVYGVDMRGVEQVGTRPKGTTPDICCS